MGRIYKYTYTDAGKLKTETDPLEHIRTYDYDGNGYVTQSTDWNKNITEKTYNQMNQPLTVTGPNPNAAVEYTYDKAGNIASMKNADKDTTQYGCRPIVLPVPVLSVLNTVVPMLASTATLQLLIAD